MKKHRTPVLLLGGGANALSIARSLGRRNVQVYVLNDPAHPVRYSRYCKWIEEAPSEKDWESFLLGRPGRAFDGAVLLTACDAGLQFIIHNREQLSKRFILDDSNPTAQLAMLDKLATYEIAAAAGVPTPKFWITSNREQVLAIESSLTYPLLVKPRLSHLYEGQLSRKYSICRDFSAALSAFDEASRHGLDVLLVEYIPGSDDRLCSYYTYMDYSGKPLFDFTKRVLRRYPMGMGGGSCHVTDRNPEVRRLALRLFQAADLRGVANAEFKRDPRDGELKLIECNARFTAANALLAACGIDLAAFVYERIARDEDRPFALPKFEEYPAGARLWDPIRDFRAFLQLSSHGALGWLDWFRTLGFTNTFPYYEWRDPLPSLVAIRQELFP